MTDTHDHDEQDVPLDPDDLLIQRYLDGTLEHEEAVEVELRMDEDDAFGSRITAYESMFAALDRSAVARAAVAWADDTMPASIVDAAMNRWQPPAVAEPEPTAAPTASPLESAISWIERFFGSWKPAAAAFAVADLVLVGLVGFAALMKDPTLTADRLVGSLDGASAAGSESVASALGVPAGFGGLDLALALIGCVALLGVGLFFLTIAPERTRNLRRTIEASPGTSLIVGSLASLGLGLLTAVLVLTCVGAPLLGGFTMLLWAAGMTGLLEAVGDRLPLPESMRSRGWDLVAGVTLFAGLSVLGTSGGWLSLLAFVVALGLGSTAIGGAVLSGLGRAPYPRAD
ncbi:MAG: hypothetical protein GY898_03035 [Proteobacteria bacterium]|nr:hypothetical protein [Pseudomonadota bacterium]